MENIDKFDLFKEKPYIKQYLNYAFCFSSSSNLKQFINEVKSYIDLDKQEVSTYITELFIIRLLFNIYNKYEDKSLVYDIEKHKKVP